MTDAQAPVEAPKAYDMGKLLVELKGEGLELTEEAAKKVIAKLFAWIRESAALSENPYDDMVVGVIKPLEKILMDKAEAINPAD